MFMVPCDQEWILLITGVLFCFVFYSGCLHLNISNTAHFLFILILLYEHLFKKDKKMRRKLEWFFFLSQVLEKQTSLAVSQQFSVLISYFSFLL